MPHSPFHEARLDAFAIAVQAAGGRMLNEPCRSDELPAIPSKRVETAYTCGCGDPVRAAVPYTREDGEHAHALVCGTCDAGTHMPRFRPAGQEDPEDS